MRSLNYIVRKNNHNYYTHNIYIYNIHYLSLLLYSYVNSHCVFAHVNMYTYLHVFYIYDYEYTGFSICKGGGYSIWLEEGLQADLHAVPWLHLQVNWQKTTSIQLVSGSRTKGIENIHI